jgi:penicillin-binding protein 1A
VLKLFARLKELSAKLLPSAAKKPRDRLLTGKSTSVNIPGAKIRVKATAAEISGNSKNPTNSGSLVPKKKAVAASPISRIGSIFTSPFRGPKPLHKRKLFWAGSGLGLGVLVLGGAWIFVDDSVSQYKSADALNYVRPGSITIKGLNGAVLLQTGEATRETLKLWQMPTNLKNAFVAIEDRRFYEHDGVDYKGVTRAMVTNLTSKNIAEGASSINQQLARVVYLDQEKSFWRKLREVRIAQKLGKELTKDQVLERYLNLVYLGEHTYGVADAAMVYFSKTVDKLSLAEMATLAAMPPAPNKYSPFVNPDFAGKRRNLVLDRMVDAKFITKAEADTAKAEPLKPKRSLLPSAEQQARYFTKYIEQELPQRITKKQIKAGGLIIETTLNPEWQKKAEEVVNTTVRQNRGSFGQAAMVSVDPRTGGIRSMVGGTDFAKNQFNRVTQAKRQPGSTFKPFVYSTAIAGGISPNKSYLDAPVEIGLAEGGNYKPKNAGKGFKGQISMRDALVNSVNIVAIKVLIDTGWQPVIDMAQKMGVQSKLEPVYSLALGALEVNLLEMTSAYTTFANKGIHNPVHGIIRVTNKKGEILYENQAKPEKVIEPDTTAIMTWMMRGVVNEGTAKSAQIGRPVAGKTGTTDKERDLWFIGFVPQLVTGVWLGNDNNQPTGNASSTAALAWSRFMTTAVKNIPVQDFLPRPDNMDRRKPELKLDPVRPRYQRTLAIPAKDDKNGEDSNNQDGSRSSRRSRRSESTDNSSSDTPRRSRRSESTDNSSSDTPRRSRRSRNSESVDNSSSENTPRRSRRSRRSESTPSSDE